jgi:hypothetical protein
MKRDLCRRIVENAPQAHARYPFGFHQTTPVGSAGTAATAPPGLARTTHRHPAHPADDGFTTAVAYLRRFLDLGLSAIGDYGSGARQLPRK